MNPLPKKSGRKFFLALGNLVFRLAPSLRPLACAAVVVLGPALATAEEPVPYQHPTLAIPYAWQKPTMDGVIHDAEWEQAASVNALQTTGQQINARQTRFWIMWDEENFYVAMRSPLRQGERPIQRHRGSEPGVNLDVIFDDSYEIWVSVGATDTLTGQPDCSTHFMANFSGGKYDAIHQPAVGNSRTSSYDTGWKPVNRLTEDNAWEMEVVIPRESLGTTERPFHDGMIMRGLFARNFKRPWEQANFEGTGDFSVIKSHSEFILSKTAPALHLLSVGDAEKGTIGLHLAAFGQTDTKIRWLFQSEAVTREGTTAVAKGRLTEVVNEPKLAEPGPGNFRITVTGEDGGVLLDWQAKREFSRASRMVPPAPDQPEQKPVREFYNPATEVLEDRGDVLDLGITFNPLRDYARVFGDFINFDNRDAIHEISIVVSDAEGKEIQRATANLDKDAYARALLKFDNLALGTYTTRLECLDKDGKIVASKESTFAKEDLAKKYEWWNTTRGSIEKVIAPWTPVTLKNDVFGIWGREMEIGPAGIPARVTTQGQDILAGPGQLAATLADGRKVVAEGVKTKTVFDEDHRKIVEVTSTLGDIDIQSEVRVEFDGMYKVTMTLTPRQPVTLKDLRVVLPYREAMGDYIHAVTAEIRSGYWYGYTPQGEGRVWASTDLNDKTMKVGSFIPYVWLGSTKGGLSWFADSDEGWIPNDKVPAIEIERNREAQVDLVLNLISEETTLDAPRTITFALQASPVKEMPSGWRGYNWWCGDTFKNYAHEENLIFSSTPFVVPEYAEKAKSLVEAQHKAGRPAVPYFIHSALLPKQWIPELKDLEDEWTSNFNAYGAKSLVYEDSLNDYMIHNWSKWAEEFGIDGYYIDNMVPMQCDKVEAGRGYLLPDGRIQPAFQMFGTREYFLRSRAAFLEQNPKSMIVIHMTNCMILPWIAAADLTYDGEHHVIYPEMDKTFMDFWSLERMRVDYPGQWGVPVDFMHKYEREGEWDPVKLHLAMRAYFATVTLHDALPYGNNNGQARNLIAQRDAFGIGEDDVRFLAYWDDTGLQAKGEDIKLAGWQRPDKLLLLVTNFGEAQDAEVTLDTAKLGWGGATLSVTDAEAGFKHQASRRVRKTDEELAQDKARFEQAEAERIAKNPTAKPKPYKQNPWRNESVIAWSGDENKPVQLKGTTLTVPVERHNYRLLIVEKK